MLMPAVGSMNSLVYPVSGGMEDWLYASGWDKSHDVQCDGLKETKSKKDIKQAENNRAIVFLVETSNEKNPQSNSLGSSENVSHEVLTLFDITAL